MSGITRRTFIKGMVGLTVVVAAPSVFGETVPQTPLADASKMTFTIREAYVQTTAKGRHFLMITADTEQWSKVFRKYRPLLFGTQVPNNDIRSSEVQGVMEKVVKPQIQRILDQEVQKIKASNALIEKENKLRRIHG